MLKLERSIGQHPFKVSGIAYGFWRFAGTSKEIAREKIEKALSLGLNLFDHADIYGVDGGGRFGDAEALFGEVIREAKHLRDQIFLATKGGIVLGYPYDSSLNYLEAAVEASLRRLHVDVIDLYQIHRPDFLTHPADLADTLVKLKASGKVREFGVSNFTASQTRALQAHLPFKLATIQPEWSCWSHQALSDGVLDLAMEMGYTPLGWSPLAGGLLGGGRQLKGEAQDRLSATLSLMNELAKRYEVTTSAIAIAWAMRHPAAVIPIIGTQRLERMDECVQAAGVTLTQPEWNSLLEAARGESLP